MLIAVMLIVELASIPFTGVLGIFLFFATLAMADMFN